MNFYLSIKSENFLESLYISAGPPLIPWGGRPLPPYVPLGGPPKLSLGGPYMSPLPADDDMGGIAPLGGGYPLISGPILLLAPGGRPGMPLLLTGGLEE